MHGEHRGVSRPSGAPTPPFYVQSRSPRDFQWEKMNPLTHCTNFISHGENVYQKVATGEVEVGGSRGGNTVQSAVCVE